MAFSGKSTCASRFFEGFKALGLISTDKPFLVRYIKRVDGLRITIPVGRYFYTYNERLQLIETSKSCDKSFFIF